MIERWKTYMRIWDFVTANGGVLLDDFEGERLDQPPTSVIEAEFFCRDGKLYNREGWQVRWEWFQQTSEQFSG
jgi:hypothetical protein